jgi:hypothetical protein
MVLTRVSQPLRCMSLPYQAGCLSATRSSRGWSTDLGSIVIDSGMLSYLTRKSTLRMGKIVAARATCSCEQQFGTIWHLAMLQPSPEAFSKIDKISSQLEILLAGGGKEHQVISVEGCSVGDGTRT